MNIRLEGTFGITAGSNQTGSEGAGRKTIFAGDFLNQEKTNGNKKFDRVSQIRQEAQKKASKILGDVFESEKKLEQQVQEMKDKCQEFVGIRSDSIKELDKTATEKASLMESYGVGEDSQEYQDLQMLRREQEAIPGTETALTREEELELERIHESGVTAFQRDMLEQDAKEKVYQEKLDSAEAGITGITSSLREIQIERLKKDPMLEAQDQAEQVMKQAGKEVISEIRSEGMEHIEEKLQEVVDKAKEKAEKKEEEEEKQEAIQEKKEQLEEQIEAAKENSSEKEEALSDLEEIELDVLDAYNNTKKKADQEIEKLIDNLEMIMDDLKGAAVDVNL